MKRFLAGLAIALLPCAALAQTAPQYSDTGGVKDATGTFTVGAAASCAASNVRQVCPVVAANVPSAAITAFGGTYILGQICTAYGTLAVRVLGPDGTTQETITTKTAPDTTGGTTLSLGAGAVLSVTVTGTTGCSATLSRVPM